MKNPDLTYDICMSVLRHEGLVREAYKDTVGVWTWGVGVTRASGHRVMRYKDNPQTIERCLEIYVWLLDKKYFSAVKKAFEGHDLTEAQWAQALSFHYNTGGIKGAAWVKSFKRGDISSAKREFMNWRKPKSIIGRRKKERDIFFGDAPFQPGSHTLVYLGVNSRYKPVGAKRMNVRAALTSALNKHLGQAQSEPSPTPTPRPIPPKGPPETVFLPKDPPEKVSFWERLFALLFKKG